MSELWPLLLSAQCVSQLKTIKGPLLVYYMCVLQSPLGIPMAMIEAKKREIRNRESNKTKIDQMAKQLDEKVTQVNGEPFSF